MSGHVLRSVMDDAEYDRERQRLIDLYGEVDGRGIEVVARRDQAFAQFYHRSGWTQDRIAAKEGKGQPWVARRLLFGRFLAFSANMPNGINAENPLLSAQNLTEGRFRSYWDQTDKNEGNENIRFRAVVRLMEGDIRIRKPQVSREVGKAVMEHFADGEWHHLDTIRNKVGCSDDDLQGVLTNMKAHGTHRSKLETRPYGTGHQYRIMRQDRMISSHELATKLGPLIKELEKEGRKNTTTMSPPTVAYFAAKIRQLLDEWSK